MEAQEVPAQYGVMVELLDATFSEAEICLMRKELCQC